MNIVRVISRHVHVVRVQYQICCLKDTLYGWVCVTAI